MPMGWVCGSAPWRFEDKGPRIGRPKRDRAKVKAGRKAARGR